MKSIQDLKPFDLKLKQARNLRMEGWIILKEKLLAVTTADSSFPQNQGVLAAQNTQPAALPIQRRKQIDPQDTVGDIYKESKAKPVRPSIQPEQQCEEQFRQPKGHEMKVKTVQRDAET
ncbi:unnamed protein product [Dovyalis caffra]|uniref:Uncharacterized protein n=1 Tax=Dovyalis caffra TaxID=77055 RepID=A0AAV1RKJ2_9ROSI|nr:unnamed protein product [Dovyalis caffra]